MLSNYYAKYNLILIDGNQFFRDAFSCFLAAVYNLSIYNKNVNNSITIPTNNDTTNLLTNCLNYSLGTYLKENKNYLKKNKIFANIVFCFTLNTIKENQEIFEYISENIINKHINKYIQSLKRKKINFHIHTHSKPITFTKSFNCIVVPTGEIIETLNIINFKLS